MTNEQEDQQKENLETDKTSIKNVTIRGIDAEVYSAFSHKLKKYNLTVGDALTKMMKDILKDFDEMFPGLAAHPYKRLRLGDAVIQRHNELKIDKQDLTDAKSRFSFLNIDTLELDSSIDRMTFLNYVKTISHCGIVKVPDSLPKLLVFSRIHRCTEVQFYKVG